MCSLPFHIPPYHSHLFYFLHWHLIKVKCDPRQLSFACANTTNRLNWPHEPSPWSGKGFNFSFTVTALTESLVPCHAVRGRPRHLNAQTNGSLFNLEQRQRDALMCYCLQLTSPQDKGVQNTINFSSRTATCKNHVVPSKGQEMWIIRMNHLQAQNAVLCLQRFCHLL